MKNKLFKLFKSKPLKIGVNFRTSKKKRLIKKLALSLSNGWLKKLGLLALVLLVIWVFAPARPVDPTVTTDQTPIVTSREIKDQITYAVADNRVLQLSAYLQAKGSPLADYAVQFVQAADKYNLDWRLLPAISGNESGFAKVYVGGTYNAWGWGGGYIRLGSWSGAIDTISQSLRENYVNVIGTADVSRIGRMYAADPGWAGKVTMYMNQIGNFPF